MHSFSESCPLKQDRSKERAKLRKERLNGWLTAEGPKCKAVTADFENSEVHLESDSDLALGPDGVSKAGSL